MRREDECNDNEDLDDAETKKAPRDDRADGDDVDLASRGFGTRRAGVRRRRRTGGDRLLSGHNTPALAPTELAHPRAFGPARLCAPRS